MSQAKLAYRNDNRRDEFLQAAKAVSKKISTIEGVVGILATGGIARGYCDDYADLDLVIYANEEKVVEIGNYIAVGWLMHKNIGLDTPVASYEKALRADAPSAYWSQVMRWDRQNTILLFDFENRIGDLLLENGQVPEAEFFAIIQKPFVGSITTAAEARQIRDALLDVCGESGLRFRFGTINEVFQHCRDNWEQASTKTKYYLSW